MPEQWYQNTMLPDGTTTPGVRAGAWEQQKLPEKMNGMTFLDIGSAEGYFAFEAERRGAKEVVAVDQWKTQAAMGTLPGFADSCWKHFQQLHAQLQSKVTPVDCSIYDLHLNRTFDVVVFSQVLYHLENPVLGIQRVREHTGGLCYFESLITAVDGDQPIMRFNRAPMVVDDESTFWIPTRTCVYAMLAICGFVVEEEVFNNPVPEGRRLCLILS